MFTGLLEGMTGLDLERGVSWFNPPKNQKALDTWLYESNLTYPRQSGGNEVPDTLEYFLTNMKKNAVDDWGFVKEKALILWRKLT